MHKTDQIGSQVERPWRNLSVHEMRRAAPLLLLGGGAAATFVATVVARRLLPEQAFVEWNYLHTLTAFFFSTGMLGSEQLILRESGTSEEGRMSLPRSAATTILASTFLFAIVYSLILDGRLFEYRLGALGPILILAIAAIKVGYQIDRTRGRLVAAQFLFNSWRIATPVLLLLFFGLHSASTTIFAGALLFGATLVFARHWRTARNLRFLQSSEGSAGLTVSYFSALVILSVLGIVDRFLVERLAGSVEFSEYVYAYTILGTPFSILGGYLGFKEAPRYKQRFSFSEFRTNLLRTTAAVSALTIAWSALCWIGREAFDLRPNTSVWIAIGIISVLKCTHGLLSAAATVTSSARGMFLANLATGFAIVLVALVALGVSASIFQALLCVGLLWALRSLSYYFIIPAPGDHRLGARIAK